MALPLTSRTGILALLQSLQAFIKTWVAKVLLFLLIGGFAVWGVSGSILSTSGSTAVAQVGETEVTINDFLLLYNNNMNEVQRRTGQALTREQARLFGIEARALSNAVAFAALDEYARIQNLSLSDETLARLLAEDPQFRDSSGRFNRESFRRAVYNAQMNESMYIERQNANAIRGQVMQSFAAGDILPRVFATALRDLTNEERKFAYIAVNREHIARPADPTDEQLKAYFEDNSKNYTAPEYRKIELLKLEPSDLADEKSISPEDIAADYSSRLSVFGTRGSRSSPVARPCGSSWRSRKDRRSRRMPWSSWPQNRCSGTGRRRS